MTYTNERYHPTKEEYKEYLDKYFPDHSHCMYCGGDVYYETTKISWGNYKPKLIIATHDTKKVFNGKEYHLCVCQECLEKAFGKSPNYSKVFNTRNDKTKYAFNVSDEDYVQDGKSKAVTKENLIKRYGEEEGLKRWESYCERQSKTNTFEYKKEKYGWTKEQFDEYNASRAVTKENLIKRYGEEEGLKKWDAYIERQKETKSFEYMCDTYGEEHARAINESKRLTLDNFIKKYGHSEGAERYKAYASAQHIFYSKVSQKFFDLIDSYLSKKYTTHYATKNNLSLNLLENHEANILGDGINIYLDYYIEELKTCIEFNGTVFHADPRYYKEDDRPNPYDKSILAKDIWDHDKERYDYLLKEHGIKTIVVWEEDYKNNFDVVKFLKENFNL